MSQEPVSENKWLIAEVTGIDLNSFRNIFMYDVEIAPMETTVRQAAKEIEYHERKEVAEIRELWYEVAKIINDEEINCHE